MYPPKEWLQRSYLLAERPFPIAGNTYFVGNAWCASHLIDTGDGLILLDTPCFSELPYLIHNITQLGFRLGDLKYLVISHAHYDHYGCARALVHLTGARTFMSRVDAEDMRLHPQRFEKMNWKLGRFNECFDVDVPLEDGDVIELGNCRIRCVLTPGHTIGVMSHFWETREGDRTLRLGIYGGAGYSGLTPERIQDCGYPPSIQEEFLRSIEKVWDEPVDITLGNHPFHNDIYLKECRRRAGEADSFVDRGEWQRFLTQLRDGYLAFRTRSREENEARLSRSWFMDYVSEYRSHPGYRPVTPR